MSFSHDTQTIASNASKIIIRIACFLQKVFRSIRNPRRLIRVSKTVPIDPGRLDRSRNADLSRWACLASRQKK